MDIASLTHVHVCATFELLPANMNAPLEMDMVPLAPEVVSVDVH